MLTVDFLGQICLWFGLMLVEKQDLVNARTILEKVATMKTEDAQHPIYAFAYGKFLAKV